MNGFWALLRKDLRLVLARPAMFVFIALFAISAGALTFYTGRFFDANRADLSLLFTTFPWLFAIFAPMLAMETLSAERRSGTAELLHALPLRPMAIILAKWLSMWLICLFALGLTMSLWISISWLGTPDHGAIIAGYLGSALLAASACALSLAASARTNSQIMAFLGGLVANTLVTIGALPSLHRLPQIFSRALADFAVPVHLVPFIRGVISLTDVMFFVLLILFGLFIACVLWKEGPWRLQKIASAALAVLLLNMFFSSPILRTVRLDLTAGHLYTLSPAAKKIIHDQTKPAWWTLYYSRALASHYPDIRNYGAQVEESLRSFTDASNGKIHLRIIDPGVDTPHEDQAMAVGMEALPTDRNQPLYFGLADETQAIIPRFDPQRAGSLEYDLARALEHNTTTQPQIALLDGIDLAGRDWFVTGRKESLIFRQIAARYRVDILGPDFGLEDLQDHILMLVHPPAQGQAQDQAISNFIAAGGRALVFLDPYSEASARPALNGLPKTGAYMSSTAPGFLVPMRLGWSSTRIVLDRDAAMPVERKANGITRTLRQPAWLGITAANMAPNSPVTTQLHRGLVMASTGRLSASASAGWTPLIFSSPNSALIDASVFATDPDPAALMQALVSTGQPYWLGAVKGGVIVLGDADMLDDDFYVQNDPVFGARAQTDNANFVLNALDWLTGADDVLALRARQPVSRTLTRIDTLRTQAQMRLRKEELKLGNTPDKEARQTLRTVRQKFHRQIKGVETLLEITNIWLAPALVLLLGGLLTLWRRRQF
ncbi:MAG: hypothetical protein COA85_13510 [Robiginitomaculum sp.]|nr:MAG: hypothetical protein COA85_13510 [Robiginitomaculum sp.]